MQRRSLFAGLAGLLAAPKVAAAVPARAVVGGVLTSVIEVSGFDISEWAAGEADGFDFVSGGVVAPGETVTLNWHDSVEAIHPLSWDAAGRLWVGREGDPPGRLIEAAQPLPQPAHGPIGVAWSGYTSEAP